MPRPYQPSLLRMLHGVTALLVPLAWITGLLIYSSHDGRFWWLPFRLPGEWIDIHGTVGGSALADRPSVRPVCPQRRSPTAATTRQCARRDGQFHHLVYSVHLLAWLLIALAVTLHGTAVLQRGGWPLARSMASVQLRTGDLPGNWWHQIRRSFKVSR